MHRAGLNRQLQRQLAELRAARGNPRLSWIAGEMRISTATASRLFAGRNRSIPWAQLQSALSVLSADQETRAAIDATWTAAKAAGSSAFTRFAEVMSPAEQEYYEAQQWADEIRIQAAMIIPPVLRTPDYHHAVCHGVEGLLRSDPILMEAALPLIQEIHTPTRSVHVILDESVFRRWRIEGFEKQMLVLLQHQQSGVLIQVYPFSADVEAGMLGPFAFLSWSGDPASDLVSIGLPHEPVHWIDTADVRARLEQDWARLVEVSSTPEELPAIVEGALRNAKGEQVPIMPR